MCDFAPNIMNNNENEMATNEIISNLMQLTLCYILCVALLYGLIMRALNKLLLNAYIK